MTIAQCSDGTGPSLRRSSGNDGPYQIARPTNGTNTTVDSHNGGRRNRTTIPIVTAIARYSVELVATPAPWTWSAPSMPGSVTSRSSTNARAVTSVNATMTNTNASQM